MSTLTFTSAVLIFVNQWLVAIACFATIACSVFLCILGTTADIDIAVAMSISTVVVTLVFLSTQCVSVSQLRQRRSRSWLDRACVHLPSITMACWLITAAVGLWKAVNLPLCESNVQAATDGVWRAGLVCWVFRTLVALDVVTLIFTFALFVFITINGRTVPISLLRIDYSHSGRGHQARRCTLVASDYGESTENLNSPMTITSEDHRILDNEKAIPRPTISPSPTYRTLDGQVMASKHSDNSPFSTDSGSDLGHSRVSTCTASTFSALPFAGLRLPKRPMTSGAGSIYASGQLQARSVSNIPTLPANFAAQIRELERMKAEHLGIAEHGPALHEPTSQPLRSAMKTTAGKIQSTHGLTLDAVTLDEDAPSPVDKPSRHISVIEQPPPAWCPKSLKDTPLSADPAIKRLTELRGNSACASRRLSLSDFEFGFGRRNTKKIGQFSTRGDLELEQKIMAEAVDGLDGSQDLGNDKENVRPISGSRGKPGFSVTQKRSMRRSAAPMVPLPPVPPRAAGQSGPSGRRRGKSMVERGRYEKLPH